MHKGMEVKEISECLRGRVVGLQRTWRGHSKRGEEWWELLLGEKGSGCERHPMPRPARVTNHLSLPRTCPVLAMKAQQPGKPLSPGKLKQSYLILKTVESH